MTVARSLSVCATKFHLAVLWSQGKVSVKWVDNFFYRSSVFCFFLEKFCFFLEKFCIKLYANIILMTSQCILSFYCCMDFFYSIHDKFPRVALKYCKLEFVSYSFVILFDKIELFKRTLLL